MNKPKSQLKTVSLTTAINYLIFFTVLISGSAWVSFGVYLYFWNQRLVDPNYTIVAIVQSCKSQEYLKTMFLAELLQLSRNKSKNLYQFNLDKNTEKIKQFPLIKDVVIQRIPPTTLFIEYSIRNPIAFLMDFSNTAIDEEGILIPFIPFYSPKKLPQILLGLKEVIPWGQKCKEAKFKLALNLLSRLAEKVENSSYSISEIDVTKSDASSLGDQKIQFSIENRKNKILAIIDPNDIKGGIQRLFLFLDQEKNMQARNFRIDLRIPHLAYVKDYF